MQLENLERANALRELLSQCAGELKELNVVQSEYLNITQDIDDMVNIGQNHAIAFANMKTGAKHRFEYSVATLSSLPFEKRFQIFQNSMNAIEKALTERMILLKQEVEKL